MKAISTRSYENRWIIFTGVLLLLVIYAQTLTFQYGLDDQLITENIPGRANGISGLLHIFARRFNQTDYRPVAVLSFALEKWTLGESNPHFSHFINVLLYALILFGVYKTCVNYIDEKYKTVVQVALLLFLVHPVHVEVVASLKSRDNLLAMLFSVIAANFMLKPVLQEKSWIYFFAGWIFYVLAFFSKLDAAGLIFFLPSLILILKPKKKIAALLYFVVLLLSLFIIRFTLIESLVPIKLTAGNQLTTFTENPLVKNFTPSSRIAAAALTFWYYIKMLLLPLNYSYYYGFDHIRLYTITQWQSIFALISTVVLMVLLIKYFSKKFLWIAAAGFLSFVFYALNFITPVAGIIAERYIFISSLFFCGCLAYLLTLLIKKENIFLLTSMILILILSVISCYRTTAWKDKLTLIERDAPHLRDSYEAMRIATSVYTEFADSAIDDTHLQLLDKAIACAEDASKTYPFNVLSYKLEAMAYFKKRQTADAKRLFQKAIANDSTEFESYNFLGDIFVMEKNNDSAYYYYNKAFYLKPDDATLINNISSLLYEKDKLASKKFNEQLLSKHPDLYAAWENLGYYYLEEKDTAKAVENFRNSFKYGLKNEEAAALIQNYHSSK